MSFVEIEIASQPDCWRRAAELAPSHAAALPAPGERVAVVGCGTSFYMAQAYASLREESGQGETDAFAASEFPTRRRYDRVVALTRSGTTTEVLELLGRLRGTTPTVAVTADPGTPVMTAADAVVVLDFADEQSVVQTRFATTLLTLLRAHLGLHTDAMVRDAEQALAEPLPQGLVDCTQFTFLGRGWTTGLANEAALKMKEARSPGPSRTPRWSTATARSPSPPTPPPPGCSAPPPRACASSSWRPVPAGWRAAWTRWPTWSASSAWPSPAPPPAASTRTPRAT